jgi:antitoxin ParD1/3/4
MNVSLTRELENFVQSKVGSGSFGDTSAVVSSALSLMQQRDQQQAWLEEELDRGLNDAKEGRLTPSSSVKAEMLAFRANWQAQRTDTLVGSA